MRWVRHGLFSVLCMRGEGLTFLHQCAHALFSQKKPVRYLAWIIKAVEQFIYNADVHPSAVIDRRVGFAHTGGVVIGANSVIRAGVVIFSGVVLGGLDRDGGHPTIDEGARLFSGCCVLGSVTIGRDAKVGANAVVLRDVPTGHTAVGVPAIIIAPHV